MYYQFHQKPQLEAIKETIKKFKIVKSWFEKQTTYHFYSASLIVIYEGDLNETKNDISDLVRVKIADFAHVFPANNTHDDNFLFGLNKLIDYLEMLLKPDYKFKDIRKN